MSSPADHFTAFWAVYPRREAKLDALKAYTKALKLASAEEILAGVERYKRTMPEERQYRPLPASWLNAGRWLDEYEVTVSVPVPEFWGDACTREHHGRCRSRWEHETRLRESA